MSLKEKSPLLNNNSNKVDGNGNFQNYTPDDHEMAVSIHKKSHAMSKSSKSFSGSSNHSNSQPPSNGKRISKKYNNKDSRQSISHERQGPLHHNNQENQAQTNITIMDNDDEQY